MSNKWMLFALPLCLALGGCPSDDDDDDGADAGPADTGRPDTGRPDTGRPDTGETPDTGEMPDTGVMEIPTRPTLGTQIDRVGRGAVSTALISPIADEPEKGTRKDEYNAAAPMDWGTFAPDIIGSLGVYDGLDGTCGNQLLAGTATAADRYATLGGALAGDTLLVNSTSTTCTTYLAVEADTLGIIPNNDCGGRGLLYDIIDVTYSALAIGNIAGVGDAVDSDNVTHDPATFPFLAAP